MRLLGRRFAATALIIALTAGLGLPSAALAAPKSSPGLYVPAATLVTADGVVLWSKNPDKPRRVASCIKMLNALVVRENSDLDDLITISSKAASVDDGAVGLVTGQKYTVRELLGVMLVHSANGAAEALATGIAGNERDYLAMMNAKAKSLGCTHTKAADPHGLSPRGYSTAHDLALIARELMADPELRRVVRQSSARLTRKSGSATYGSTDRLLGSYPGIEGIKTGYTDPAGYCFVGAAKQGDAELFGVVLGAEASNDRFTQMRRLLDWGFKHVTTRTVVSKNATMGVVEVASGTEATVSACTRESLALEVCDAGGSLTTKVSVPASLTAPVQAGQTIGTVQVTQGDEVLATVPLVADKTVARVAPMPVAAPKAAASASGSPSVWQRVAAVFAGLGKMLGI